MKSSNCAPLQPGEGGSPPKTVLPRNIRLRFSAGFFCLGTLNNIVSADSPTCRHRRRVLHRPWPRSSDFDSRTDNLRSASLVIVCAVVAERSTLTTTAAVAAKDGAAAQYPPAIQRRLLLPRDSEQYLQSQSRPRLLQAMGSMKSSNCAPLQPGEGGHGAVIDAK
jgi:hypothetical protein